MTKRTTLAEEPRMGSSAMYHVALSKDDVGRIAFLPGDPDRVQRIAAYFKQPREVSSHREYRTWDGTLSGKRVTVTSTGIGGPAMAIAVEELARLGVDTMIRVGTCGSISRDLDVGSLIIADSSVRLDGTTRQYVMDGYPAAATPGVVIALENAAAGIGAKFCTGTIASTDSFYVGQGRKGFNGYLPEKARGLIKGLQDARVLGFEMEASVLFTLGRLYGIRTGAVMAVIANRVTGDFKVDAGVDLAIKTAINAAKSI